VFLIGSAGRLLRRDDGGDARTGTGEIIGNCLEVKVRPRKGPILNVNAGKLAIDTLVVFLMPLLVSKMRVGAA
jgi:hypothetical protein